MTCLDQSYDNAIDFLPQRDTPHGRIGPVGVIKVIRNISGALKMTETIDKMLVKTGFDERELKQSRLRAWLYFGIAMMLFTSLIFFGMLAFSY